MAGSSNEVMKTVREHLESLTDAEVRDKCLKHLDQSKAELKCYSAGMAIMLGVNQYDMETKQFWERAYYHANTGK